MSQLCLTDLRRDDLEMEDTAELGLCAHLALITTLVLGHRATDPDNHHQILQRSSLTSPHLRDQMLVLLLMAVSTLWSAVKISWSTVRMWPSFTRTQDTDLTKYSTRNLLSLCAPQNGNFSFGTFWVPPLHVNGERFVESVFRLQD